ncbi:cytochrome P450 3A30-like [Hemitrygon akajei]|uniref:cytochrome P450 3A30-like n=1 Tax=Hemitrygon akajei TaxID=2704970 RepID=UPI003BF97B8C
MAVFVLQSLNSIRAALSDQTCILILTALVLLACYSVLPYGVFKRLGIPGPRPLPFIGTFLHYRKGMFKFDTECYQKYGTIWGIYDGRQPVLCITDPDLIKTVLIKEFYTLFTNRRNIGLNGPFEETVGVVADEKWKKIRNVLSPAFSSGRLKEMWSIINHHAEKLVKLAEKKASLNEAVNVKDICGPYGLDVISSISFSVDFDSINNADDFIIVNVKKLVKFSLFNPAVFLALIFPAITPILEKLQVSFIPIDVAKFLMETVLAMRKKRQKNGSTDRVDFLQVMIDSQANATNSEHQSNVNNSTRKAMTDSEVLAQCIVFIMGGYETASTTLSNVLYNLAMYPDVQKKLQQEIDEAFPNKAQPTYGVMHLEYLEMVISETLRLYPPAPRLDRVCKKDVKLNGVTIPKDTVVVVPVYVLHRDPKYWQEPEEFRPERFSKEEWKSSNSCIYLPFGLGPRNCIAKRFAQFVIKMGLVSLLQRLTFVPCKETPVPLEIDVKGPMHPKKPIILKLVPRTNTDSKE